ncbi:MAG: PASTA domain-containing protein [Bacilli bacterium]|nr:PASTA domain-containing protein [Bacilli bacterium]
MNLDSITKWVISNRLKLEFTDKYDDKVKDNHVISSNHKKGDIIEQGSLIELVISKGKLKMPKFTSLAEFYEWADKYSIKYEEKHEFSDVIKQGEVIKYSVKAGRAIKNNEVIIVTISDGKECKVPDLKDLTKSEAIKRLKSAHLNYNFIYSNSNSIKKDKVISQSIKAGSKVSNNTTITVTLSNGKKETSKVNERKSSTTNKTGNSNRNTNSSKNNNVQPAQPQKVCNTCTISSSALKNVIRNNEGYNAVANALVSEIKALCPGITVNIYGDTTSDKTPGAFVGGFSGGTVNSCNSVSITLSKKS